MDGTSKTPHAERYGVVEQVLIGGRISGPAETHPLEQAEARKATLGLREAVSYQVHNKVLA